MDFGLMAALRQTALFVVVAACPAIAFAVEPSVEVSGGGLAFAPNASLSVETQDIVIAQEKVAITYAIRNNATTAQTILVAFPLPDIDSNIISEADVALAGVDPQNFVRTETLVDGQPAAFKIEQRAMALGLDVSTTLKALDLPLFPYSDGIGLKLEAMDAVKRQELIDSGILKDDAGVVVPAWTLKTVSFWRQSFKPGQTVTILHSYLPIAGVSEYAAEAMPQIRQRACVTDAADAAIAKLAPAAGSDAVRLTTVGYLAVPGADSLGPVRRFRLIIESGDPKTIVSTCRDGLKKTGPMQTEWTAADFTLDEDLQVLFAR